MVSTVVRPSVSYNETKFLESAQSQFKDYILGSRCGVLISTVQHLFSAPTQSTTGLSISVTSFTSTTQLSPSSSLTSEAALASNSVSPVSSPRTKIIVGTMIPITFIALSILGIVLWHRYRFRRSVPGPRQASSNDDDLPPFLQQKSELHGDQSRHEMEDEHRRQEAQAEEIQHQMMDDGIKPELEGDHCLHELQAPSDQ